MENAALVARVFGASSESIDPAPLELLLQLPASTPAPETPLVTTKPWSRPRHAPARNAQRACRKTFPSSNKFSTPRPGQPSPGNGAASGRKSVNSSTTNRAVSCAGGSSAANTFIAPIAISPLPASLQERGLAAPGLLAHILVSKYGDPLPLYRQEQIFARRHNVHLPRQTLARWVELAPGWLKPIYETIRTGVMAGGYVQIDKTPLRYPAPGHGQTKQGYLWTAHRPRGDVLYRWETSRAAACLENLVPVDFTGTIQCDGYASYGAFVDQRPQEITLAGGGAHVRRKFHDALEQSPRPAGWLMRQLQHLYRIEAKLREQSAGPNLRFAMRAHQSQPILTR